MLISSAVIKSSGYPIHIRNMGDGVLSITVEDRCEEGLDPKDLLEAIKRAPRGNNHKFETHQFITGVFGRIGIISNEGKHFLVFEDDESESSNPLLINLSVLESAIRSCTSVPEIKPPLPIFPVPEPYWTRPEWVRKNDDPLRSPWPFTPITCGTPGVTAIPNNQIYVNGMRVR